VTSKSILQKFIQSKRGPWSIFRIIKTHHRFSSVHCKKTLFDPELTQNLFKVSISKLYDGFFTVCFSCLKTRKSHLQASVIIPNLAPIATSHSSARKMVNTQMRKHLKKQHSKWLITYKCTKTRTRTHTDIRSRTNGPEDRVSPI